MRFPLTQKLLDEADAFALRSSCIHCRYYLASTGACVHEWPNELQKRWPLGAPEPDGSAPTIVDFCREFELA